jgi:hypothetical protein
MLAQWTGICVTWKVNWMKNQVKRKTQMLGYDMSSSHWDSGDIGSDQLTQEIQ